jgi:hypothetical protein
MKTGMSFGLHFVQMASRTPCSLHMAPSAGAALFPSERAPAAIETRRDLAGLERATGGRFPVSSRA